MTNIDETARLDLPAEAQNVLAEELAAEADSLSNRKSRRAYRGGAGRLRGAKINKTRRSEKQDYAAIPLRARPGETSKSAETLKRSRSLRTIVMLKSRFPVKTSLTRLAVPSNGTRSARVRLC